MAPAPIRTGDGLHEAVADHNRVHGDDRHLGVAAVTFDHQHGADAGVDGLLQRLASVHVLNLDHVVAACGAGHACQIGLATGIGRLIPGGAIGSIVDDHQDVVVGAVVADGRQRAEVGQNRTVTVNGNDSLVLRQREAQPDGRRKPHGAQHVEVAGLVHDGMQLLRRDADVADNQLILEDRCDFFENFRTDHWSP